MYSIPFPTIALVLALGFSMSLAITAMDTILLRKRETSFISMVWITAVLWGWFYWLTH